MIDRKKSGQPPGIPSPASGERADRTGKPNPKMKDHSRDLQTASPPAEAESAAGDGRKRHAEVKDHIGRQLRALYDEVASQPVPDRFMELLNRLDVKRGEE